MTSIDNPEPSGISIHANTSIKATPTVGAPVENFHLPDVRGGDVTLHEVLKSARAVLVFYRGGWCPICNRQLAKLSSRYEEFRSRGLEILAISNEELAQGQKVLAKVGPPFPLLLDRTSEVISQLGLAVTKRDPLGWILQKRFYAHPAVIIVGRDSAIEWVHYGRSYRDRPSPDTLLNAADSTAPPHPNTGQPP